MKARYGIFLVLAFAAALIGCCGVLLESALRAHAPADRYAGAAAVVTGPREVSQRVRLLGSEEETQRRPVTERPRVPAAAAERLRAVPGVRDVVADVSFPVTATGGTALTGHGWSALARLQQGRAPRSPGEVALAAGAGPRVGQRALLQIGGAPQPFTVTGLVASGAYFEPRTAAALSGRPGQADALVVLAGGPVDAGRLRAAVPGLTVATGAERGDAEDVAVAAARPDMIDMAASLATLAVMMVLLVGGGLIALSIRERGRELALLRAVGATPRQVRAGIVRENVRLAVWAGLVGGILSLPLGTALHAAMIGRDVLPEGFGLSLSPAPPLAALLVVPVAAAVSALLASLRLSRIRPVQALGEAAAERGGPPRWRVITGVVFLVLGVNALGASALTSGPGAVASVGGLVISLIVATAFLSPVIARGGVRVLGGPARRLDPVAGRLAAHAAGAATLRAGSVLTPVALAVAFAGTQLFVHSTVVGATDEQARAATRADQVVVSAGPGLPAEVARAVRATPGVTAATAVRGTTVVMAVRELGEQQLRSLPARGVSPEGLERTTDPGVVSGRLDGLRGGAVALSRDVAGGIRVGQAVPLRLADGTAIRPRVAAIYERGLGLGDVLLPRDLVAAHSSSPLDDHVLVRGRADLRPVAARYAGAGVVTAEAFAADRSRGLRLEGFMTRVVTAAVTGFVVIGLVTTLALATAARRREFALLRLAGATRRQVLRSLRLEAAIVLGTGAATGSLIAAVTLMSFATAVTGLPLPWVPPLPAALILIVVGGSGAAAMILPARVLLRRESPEAP
ncbi:FtsX-like permease family protein [Actinomadura viridis]|uniref:ABC transport system permease protein n=1 Tax=Actinomadura viridis TaxID=58110 RepID=A0A931DHS9_9ACTN|nr:ABC transporter permease [Actinomadura viridis]MBG6090310.1 putative ABC transport system permease protein [Actinomadura viridis]